MNKQNPVPGWNWTAEYMASGIPVVRTITDITSSVQRIDYDFVTRDVTLAVSGSGYLRLGFTENGVNGSNYFLLAPGSTTNFEVRVKSLFLKADTVATNCSILAGCTTIPAKQMLTLSGSSVSGSLAWNGVG